MNPDVGPIEQDAVSAKSGVGIWLTSGVGGNSGTRWLALWRAYDGSAASEPAAAISADLDVLDVPHVVVPAFRPPTGSGGRTRLGQEVRITSEHLPRLLRWVSSLHPPITGLPTGSTGSEFTYLEPRGTQIAIVHLLSLASDWPYWNHEQAAAMGLLCAKCGDDLRARDNSAHRPVNIASSQDDRRLICSECFTRMSAPDPAA